MIGIHYSPDSFADRWIEACRQGSIPFKLLDCHATDVVRQCTDVRAVLWNWSLNDARDQLTARQVVAALEKKEIVVFPNLASCWHYDDKIGQKLLLEAVGAPLVATWVFTDREEAKQWIGAATWPKVFKLRCGAGSSNVRLVRSEREAWVLWRRAFASGFAAHPGYLNDLGTRVRKAKNLKDIWGKLRRAPRSLMAFERRWRTAPRERGYMYFQEFLPGNTFDTRITVIGARAFGFLRENRPGDFRASGSGRLIYEPTRVDQRCVEIAFSVAQKLGTQSLAFDFLLDADHQPRIVEMSYSYVASAVHGCDGHWDTRLRWHEGRVWPQDAILEDVLASIGNREPTVSPVLI